MSRAERKELRETILQEIKAGVSEDDLAEKYGYNVGHIHSIRIKGGIKKKRGRKPLDITTSARLIHNRKWVIEKLNQGFMLNDFAKVEGVTKERARQILKDCHNINTKDYSEYRYQIRHPKLSDRDWVKKQYSKKSMKNIAKSLKTTTGAVSKALEYHDIKRRSHRENQAMFFVIKHHIDWGDVRKLHAKGLNGQQIARKSAKTESDIPSVATRIYRYMLKNGMREKRPKSSYDHVDWNKVRKMYRAGKTFSEIAKNVAKPENNLSALTHRISETLAPKNNV